MSLLKRARRIKELPRVEIKHYDLNIWGRQFWKQTFEVDKLQIVVHKKWQAEAKEKDSDLVQACALM